MKTLNLCGIIFILFSNLFCKGFKATDEDTSFASTDELAALMAASTANGPCSGSDVKMEYNINYPDQTYDGTREFSVCASAAVDLQRLKFTKAGTYKICLSPGTVTVSCSSSAVRIIGSLNISFTGFGAGTADSFDSSCTSYNVPANKTVSISSKETVDSSSCSGTQTKNVSPNAKAVIKF
ncbi:MAG TPA: hypothetical protein PKV80_18585 [Leptospiraceae bacterium]|nr:hypothetical protein [Leptospiraceae bacterium]